MCRWVYACSTRSEAPAGHDLSRADHGCLEHVAEGGLIPPKWGAYGLLCRVTLRTNSDAFKNDRAAGDSMTKIAEGAQGERRRGSSRLLDLLAGFVFLSLGLRRPPALRRDAQNARRSRRREFQPLSA